MPEVGRRPPIRGASQALRRARRGPHVGIFETSIMLAVRAGLVDIERAASLPLMPIDFDRRLRAARDFRELGNGLGYTGSPGAASAAIGRALIRRYARVFGDLVLSTLAAAMCPTS
ncbi:MAG TPA: creatininase family protein [Candidatus Dormibacteraeota bacterium]|nr:creatininase family protein [Candidatus Dormibacteraeota bacterium]